MQICVLAIILFTVTSARAQSDDNQKARRIGFARGTVSKTIKVSLTTLRPHALYVIKTRAGRKLNIRVFASAKSKGIYPVIIVTSPSGKSSALDDPKAGRFAVRRTVAGDYTIRVGTNLMASETNLGTVLLRIRIR